VKKPKNRGQQWVFREPSEKWLADCIHPKEKDKGISLMVWAAFGAKEKVLWFLSLKISRPGISDS